MKDKRPVADQVAELSADQIKNIKRFFWIQIPIIVVAVVLLIGGALLSISSMVARYVSEEYFESVPIDLENMEKKDEAARIYDTVSVVTMVVACISLTVCTVLHIAVIAAFWIMSQKMPYYTEKRAFYIIFRKKNNVDTGDISPAQ